MLTNIKINNFRNIEEETFELYQKTAFLGKNELGKTNHLVALYWLLTGEIIEPDECENNKQLKGEDILPAFNTKLATEVSANLNGYEIKRTFAEKWTRTRGTSEEVFSGYETVFSVDGAKIPATKVNDKILEISNCNFALDTKLNKVSMLIDPLYLILKSDYKDLRKTVFSLAGEVSIDEVLANGDYSFAESIIRKGSLEQARTSLKTVINSYKTLIDTKKGEIKALEGTFDKERLIALEKQKEALNERKYNKYHDVLIDEKQSHLSDLKDAKYSIMDKLSVSKQKDVEASINPKVEVISKKINDLSASMNKLKLQGKTIENELEIKKRSLSNLKVRNGENSNLRLEKINELAKISERKFEEVKCPNCGELLNKQDASLFEQKNIKDMEVAKRMITYYENQINTTVDSISKLNIQIQELEEKRSALGKQYSELKEQYTHECSNLETEKGKQVQVKSDETIKYEIDLAICEDDIQKCSLEINDLKAKEEEANASSITSINEQLKAAEDEITSINVIVANLDKKALKEKELKDIINAQAIDETKYFQLDTFIKEQAKLTNEKVSLWFDVDFRVLEKQINGGYQECCYPVYKDVKCGNINTAEKIKIGIKIINAIRNNMKLGDLPILFDRGESLDDENMATLCDNQIITTKVTNDDVINIIEL